MRVEPDSNRISCGLDLLMSHRTFHILVKAPYLHLFIQVRVVESLLGNKVK